MGESGQVRFFLRRWDKSRFYEGGSNVVFLTIGGTNVVFLAIGGTNVDLIEGGTNVGGTNVGGTNVCGRKVASSMRDKIRNLSFKMKNALRKLLSTPKRLTSLNPAKANYIALFIEKFLQSNHLCATATFFGVPRVVVVDRFDCIISLES